MGSDDPVRPVHDEAARRGNWWLPGWLDRLLPDVDIEAGAGLPEPEYEAVAVLGTDPEPAFESA
jgi:RND superfamily putative drug exporter